MMSLRVCLRRISACHLALNLSGILHKHAMLDAVSETRPAQLDHPPLKKPERSKPERTTYCHDPR
jgi:hypothetical protein